MSRLAVGNYSFGPKNEKFLSKSSRLKGLSREKVISFLGERDVNLIANRHREKEKSTKEKKKAPPR